MLHNDVVAVIRLLQIATVAIVCGGVYAIAGFKRNDEPLKRLALGLICCGIGLLVVAFK
jgi:hypothetical protein